MRLLPERQATLAAALTPPLSVVDRWSFTEASRDVPGDDALGVAIVGDASGSRVVVPGSLTGPERETLPASRLLLTAHDQGDFTVHRLAEGKPGPGEREISTDQANESILVGEGSAGAVVVKWQLFLGDEPGPGADLMASLAEFGFEEMPEPVLIARWQGFPIATVTRFIPGARDGWDWAVGDLRAWALGHAPEPIAPFRELGTMCARMHRALSLLGTWEIEGETLRMRALESLATAEAVVDPVDAALLKEHRARVLELFKGMCGRRLAIRVHGDLHVGQVLRGDDGVLRITDFDGNPVLSAAEQLEPQPPARDVAGMLASIDHVARVVVHRTEGVDAGQVEAWITRAQGAFLDAYRVEAGDLLDETLLRPMQAEQECREFTYAARHLPHWRYVPAAALPALMED